MVICHRSDDKNKPDTNDNVTPDSENGFDTHYNNINVTLDQNNTNSNNHTNEHQTKGNELKTPGAILLYIALIVLAILAISLCIICIYLHHAKFEFYRLQRQHDQIRLHDVQKQEGAQCVQRPTEL